MRTLILPVIALVILAVFSSCTTTVRSPSGRSASIGTRVQR
jgi:hypothetical protein